jgi:hypothetical protein
MNTGTADGFSHPQSEQMQQSQSGAAAHPGRNAAPGRRPLFGR